MDDVTVAESSLKEAATASELIESRMAEYAEFTVRTKLPHCVSGLKTIQNRILMTIGTSDEQVKVNPLAGQVMHWHPHGNNSIEDAITRMAQHFSDLVPLLVPDGNCGSYDGKSAAAGRYLIVSGSEFMRDVFFNRTNLNTLNLIPAEAGRGEMEYEYFIPCIPYALCTAAMGIAIGWKTDVVPLSLESVCDLVVDYVKLHKKGVSKKEMYTKLYKHLLPDFTCHSLMRNSAQCYKAYQEGKFDVPIKHDGIVDLYPNMIVMQSLPYSRTFSDAYKTLGEMVVSKKGFIAEHFDTIDDHSEDKEDVGVVECTLRRGVHPFDVLAKLKEAIGFEGQFTPIMNWYTPTRRMNNLNPIEILDVWYTERYRSILADLKHTQNRLVNKHREYEALSIICGHSKDVVEIFDNAPNREATIEPLVQRFGITTPQAVYLSQLTLGQLPRSGKDELLAQCKKIASDIAALQTKFVSIPETIMEDALYIKKKYAHLYPRKAKLPNFMGNVMLDDKGVIQFSSYKEMYHIEKRFPNSQLKITLYPTGNKATYYNTPYGVMSNDELDAPKQDPGNNITVCKHKAKYTVVLNDGKIYRLSGIISPGKTGEGAYYVGDTFTAIQKNGKVVTVNSTDIPLRKTAPAQGVMCDYVYITATPIPEGGSMLVAYGNTSIAGELRIENVSSEATISRTPMGKTLILGTALPDEPMALNIPDEIRPRGGIRHLILANPIALVQESSLAKIALSKKASRKEHLVLMHAESECMIDMDLRRLLE